MYSLGRCKKPTYLCGCTKHLVSCKASQGRERKFGEIRAYLSPWYSVCTKAMFISKEARVMESPKMYSLSRCKKPTYLCGYANYLFSCKAAQAENGNLGKSGPTFRHGTGFAPKQCLYQKEARAMEIPKMYSLSRCKKPTYVCGYVKYPVSCKAAKDREQKFGEIQAYVSAWRRVCTKAMFISKGS